MHYDKEFLLKLDKDRQKTIYARITTLQFDESPIETIEGRVTQGSINVDGNSALRRSCSLTMVSQDYDYSNYLWGLNTKFKLEIGVQNNIDSFYPSIIWFKQGIYLITSMNTSSSPNSFTLSLSGKDKMCLLNGEVSGSFESSIDFGAIEEYDDKGIVHITKIPIPDIIRNMLHQYAGEPYHNIIINDLDTLGLELLEYRYDIPMYLYRKAEPESPIFTNALLNGNMECWREGEEQSVRLKDLTPEDLDLLVDTLTGSSTPTKIRFSQDGEYWYVAKIEFGQTAGYRTTDLTYAGDLIANIGESITSILDKIKNMLGEFEYFYDVDGQFTFQKKRSIANTFWTPMNDYEDENQEKEALALASTTAYSFNEGELITALSNSPNLLNLKNDYSIWGARTTPGGAEVPVHMRYAIDQKPIYYKAYNGKIYTTDLDIFKSIFEDEKIRIKQEYFQRVENYQPTYRLPAGLEKPIRDENYNWSPGWWDIRDWYDYYQCMTGSIPNWTMKWYSRNDESGCVPQSTIPGYEENGGHCWLIIKYPNGTYSFGYGGGTYNESSKRSCTLYESYYDSTAPNGYRTVKVLDENGAVIKKDFCPPYSGCTDTHTYLEFLMQNILKQGQEVYFYNPAFPAYEKMEDLLDAEIKEEWEKYLTSGELNLVDWREIIYQMALDFYAHNTEEDYELKIAENNAPLYPTGQTGYEQYYIDMQGFWRELYNLHPDETEAADYYLDGDHQGWKKAVYEKPETLNFWFDFLDTEGELSQFNIKSIGARSKPINDKDVKSIYFRETPNIIFDTDLTDNESTMSGYKYVQVKNIDSMFSTSAQGKSAKDKLDELIYKHSYCIESATITTIPIYYLEPNTRIYLHDTDSKLDGDYIISKISIPLSYNGTMSITATKAAKNIL